MGSKTGPNRSRSAALFRMLRPANEDAGEGDVVAAAHPVVVRKQELSHQGQINDARIRGIGGEMQASPGRSRGAIELSLVGGHDRFARPIGLAVGSQLVAD